METGNNLMEGLVPVEDVEFSQELDKILSETEVFARNILRGYSRGVELCEIDNNGIKDVLGRVNELAKEYNIGEESLKNSLDIKLRTLSLLSY